MKHFGGAGVRVRAYHPSAQTAGAGRMPSQKRTWATLYYRVSNWIVG